MRRRAARPGLLGTVARTAVIAGTAQAAAGSVAQKQAAQQQAGASEAAAKQAAEAELADLRGQVEQLRTNPGPAVQAAAAPAAPAGADFMAQLQQLAAMKEAGLLPDAEFAAA